MSLSFSSPRVCAKVYIHFPLCTECLVQQLEQQKITESSFDVANAKLSNLRDETKVSFNYMYHACFDDSIVKIKANSLAISYDAF